uniref:Translocase of outer mitochondrial membrane 40 homolog (yeast) n=1 Tax=Paramormyrops kingsleyae TaxID=1676925 RepID=A0A3B3QT46_9TELE
MGSVLAASPQNAPPATSSSGSGGLVSVPPGFTMPPVSSLSPSGIGSTTSVQQSGDTEGSLPNPGTFEECHRKCKEIFPLQMDGVKLVVNKGLSNHFQVCHTIALSTLGDSSYRFGATYVGTKQTGPAEFFPVLVGDMDNSGSLNAQVIHQLTSRIRSKMVFQTQQQKFMNWQCDAEYKGDDFTATVTLGNPDALAGSGSNYIATLTVGGAGAHASYYHKANDQLQVGVEFEASTRMQDTSVSFGYQLDLPKANLLFKGSLDSNWVIGATLEKKLVPLPLSLALGAFLNHRKNKFQCGFGVTIG